MRVWIMSRVSTEEQAKQGLSVETQRERLRKWAKDNDHVIVGESIDAGISGKKPYAKRPGLLRFMEAIQSGVKVDALAFTKLDRFYRSVRLYYQATDIMDKHGVGWIAIDEDYETTTAGGRFKVNIMLSVAENEADRTAERIKVIFDGKVSRGEIITGAPPTGYRVEEKKYVPGEDADAMRALFRHYLEHGSIGAARKYVRDYYGLVIQETAVRKKLTNTLYKGEYRGRKDFCEPLIAPEVFDAVQKRLASSTSTIRLNQSGRAYLFSGLLVCAVCGTKMSARHSAGGGREYFSYRCRRAACLHTCDNHRHAHEKALEEWLVANIGRELEDLEISYTQREQERKRPKINRAAVAKKLERLNDLYIDGRISREKYDSDYQKISKQLEEAVESGPTVKDVERVKSMTWAALQGKYKAFSREEKRDFWHSIIEKIEFGQDGEPVVFFKL